MKTAPRPVTPRPVRVLMTTDAVGGVWSYSMELVQGFSRLGFKVALAVMGGRPSRAARADVRRIEGVELHESTFKLEWQKDPWADVDAASRWLEKLALEFKPDLVHLNEFSHGAVDFGVPVLMVAHSDVLSWHEAVRKQPAGGEWDEYRARVRLGLAGADLVVAPTAAVLTSLQRNYGALPYTAVIPNGRSLGLEGPAPKEPFVFSAGRLWDEAKNLMSLDAAAPKMTWPVYVAGDAESPDHQSVEAKNVQMLGRLHPKTIANWFARAAIYAAPARYEPFGLTALEAGLSGCALVLGDISSLREVWHDAAVYVPPDDPEALARTVNQLIASDRLRRELAQKAVARAQMFAGCRMLAGYTKAYRELTQGDAAARGAAAARKFAGPTGPVARPAVARAATPDTAAQQTAG